MSKRSERTIGTSKRSERTIGTSKRSERTIGTTTRFWLRPKWVVGHLLCLLLVVVFVNLGFWQLHRLHGRRAVNHMIHTREAATPVSLDDALRAGKDGALFRRAWVDGRWDSAATVLVRSKSLDEQPGYDVLTPLVVDGEAVVVLRGFVQLGGGGETAILDTVRPRAGSRARVDGVLRAGETRGSFGPRDPATGTLTVVNRIDIERLQHQTSERLVPLYLQLVSSTPAEPALIRTVPLPSTNDGPHLSYAIQWFIFAGVGAVGWPLLLRKTAHDQGREPDERHQPA